MPTRQLPTGQRSVGHFVGIKNAAQAELPPARFPPVVLQYGALGSVLLGKMLLGSPRVQVWLNWSERGTVNL